jgi:hypothetical protein
VHDGLVDVPRGVEVSEEDGAHYCSVRAGGSVVFVGSLVEEGAAGWKI